MKKILIIVSLFVSFVFSACNDYLDKAPDNRASLNSPKAVRELLVSAYPDQTYQVFTESMSDNVSDRGPQANAEAADSPSRLTSEQAYNWEDMKGEDQDEPTSYWAGCYKAIASCNHALQAIVKNGDGPEYAAQKGEALVCRAYAHFMLVNIFAEHYDSLTAKTALGIPYVTEPERVVFKEYTRNTIKEVYQKIIADFTTGFPLINDAVYPVRSYHFTKNASAAFASRLYTYLGEPDSVIKYSGMVLGSTPQSLVRDWNGLYQKFASTAALSTQYDKADDPANIMIIGCVSWLYRAAYNRYALDINLLKTVAYKVNVTGGQNAFLSISGGICVIPKYFEYFKRESINANYGVGYVMVPSFTIEEVLFNRAEAYVMKNDFTNALKDLNAYYPRRIDKYNATIHMVTAAKVTAYAAKDATIPAPAYALSAAQIPYIKVILDARRAEFIHEGLRWFDIKRMHLAITHAIVGGSSITLTPSDLRRAVQIPLDALAFGIVPNTRLLPPIAPFSEQPILLYAR